jgi:glycine dehydrogenase subunit 1
MAKAAGALLLVTVPEVMSLGLFEPPGAYGADIATSEGLGYGVGLQIGGPACGMFAAKQDYLRQMPGRLIGETVDSEGERGYVLTLSTREQFIRREKATSNICTNQGLLALGFAMHLALLGKQGFVRAARQNMARALRLKERLLPLGYKPRFSGTTFNEVAFKVPGGDAQKIADRALQKCVIAGLPLGRFYPELEDTLLICTTEAHSPAEIDQLVEALKEAAK